MFACKIFDGEPQTGDRIPKSSEGSVASVAQSAAKAAGFVVMVDAEATLVPAMIAATRTPRRPNSRPINRRIPAKPRPLVGRPQSVVRFTCFGVRLDGTLTFSRFGISTTRGTPGTRAAIFEHVPALPLAADFGVFPGHFSLYYLPFPSVKLAPHVLHT